MKKCIRCKIIFQLEERTRCLYCDSILVTVGENEPLDIQWGDTGKTIALQILNQAKLEKHEQIQYIIASYFRIRTFHFMYSFSRNEFKMGKGFKRLLVQPFNITFILMLPWVVVNLVDSFFMRLLHNGYCEKCGWKYKAQSEIIGHEKGECEYNQEYSAIVNDILSGRILKTERIFKERGDQKIEQGKRSAYFALCSTKDYFSSLLDVGCVWFSVCLILYTIVGLVFPMTMRWIINLNS